MNSFNAPIVSFHLYLLFFPINMPLKKGTYGSKMTKENGRQWKSFPYSIFLWLQLCILTPGHEDIRQYFPFAGLYEVMHNAIEEACYVRQERSWRAILPWGRKHIYCELQKGKRIFSVKFSSHEKVSFVRNDSVSK